MATTDKSDARLNFRVSSELKQTIEEAAALTGQNVSDFAISVLTQSARSLIQEHDQTVLTQRDRNAFVALLDKMDGKPNDALASAARRYKKQTG